MTPQEIPRQTAPAAHDKAKAPGVRLAREAAAVGGRKTKRRAVPFHVLVKFTPSPADAIKRHGSVLREHGEVLFGKFGARLSDDTLKRLNRQISDGVETFLFLVTRHPQGYELHRCQVASVTSTRTDADRHLVPGYYSDAPAAAWFHLKSIKGMQPSDANRITVISSGRPIGEVLSTQKTVFYVSFRAQETH